MKKILLLLFFFFLFTFHSTSKEIDYFLLDVSDLLKRGFKIIKQENIDGVETIFLTNNRDFVRCTILFSNTSCKKQ